MFPNNDHDLSKGLPITPYYALGSTIVWPISRFHLVLLASVGFFGVIRVSQGVTSDTPRDFWRDATYHSIRFVRMTPAGFGIVVCRCHPRALACTSVKDQKVLERLKGVGVTKRLWGEKVDSLWAA